MLEGEENMTATRWPISGRVGPFSPSEEISLMQYIYHGSNGQSIWMVNGKNSYAFILMHREKNILPISCLLCSG